VEKEHDALETVEASALLPLPIRLAMLISFLLMGFVFALGQPFTIGVAMVCLVIALVLQLKHPRAWQIAITLSGSTLLYFLGKLAFLLIVGAAPFEVGVTLLSLTGCGIIVVFLLLQQTRIYYREKSEHLP